MMANILLSPAAVALYCLGVAAAAAGVIRWIWMRKPKAVPSLYQRIRAAERVQGRVRVRQLRERDRGRRRT